MPVLIEVKDITKTYHIGRDIEVPVLKKLSLQVEQGDFVAIMGASGSGKSTLLSILGLLDRPDSGKYLLLGKDITGISDSESASLRSRFFGFVFQAFNLLPRTDLLSNVFLPLVYSGRKDREKKKEVVLLMEKVGLGGRLKHKPNEISGGQQQRVALVRALANDPLVVLADEPTGNLDSRSAHEIIALFKEMNQKGNTIIMVTHEPQLAKEASRVITLSDGAIVSDERTRRPCQEGQCRPLEELMKGKDLGKRQHFSREMIGNYLVDAFSSLLANKLRSFLSILGVVIGVGAIIAMLAVGTGAQVQVQQSLSALGSNLLMVRSVSRTAGISFGADSVTRFTFEDVEAVRKLDGVKYVVPYVTGRGQAVYGNKNWSTSITGTTPQYQDIRNAYPELGRFFTSNEMSTRAKVAVLGATVAKELFGDSNPVNKSIKINKVNFKVIGVIPEKGVSGFRNMDDQIAVPATTAMKRLLGTDYINYFDVQTDDPKDLDILQQEIVPALVKLHRLPDSQSDVFDIRNMADVQKAARETVSTFSFLLGAIAAVSLLVGGIGIMNIMLVMVMERTHEIGLRKALGADSKDIVYQFLIEAVLISVLGGAIGILIGVGISSVISIFAGWSVYVTVRSVVLSFVFSVMVGVIFGIWPARKAAKLMPIEALRYE